MARPACHLIPSRLFSVYEPNISRSSAFFGDLDEPDFNMGTAKAAWIELYPWWLECRLFYRSAPALKADVPMLKSAVAGLKCR